MRRSLLPASVVVLLAAAACSSPGDEPGEVGQEFSSREATLLDFEFDGELVTDSTWNVKQKIEDQFLYTIGHLNAQRSVGRLDRLELSNVQTRSEAGQIKVTYHARLPVAWGSKTNLPSSYPFTLPKVVTFAGLESFTSKYKASCVDSAAHDVDSGSMWYYFRPKTSGCNIEPTDVVTFTASVTRSTQNTTGKFPEYHKVWEDDALEVVAIFGKNEDGAGDEDVGVDAFNAFVASMRSALAPHSLTTLPTDLGSAAPGTRKPDVTLKAKLDATKSVQVTALLVDNVRTAGAAFDQRYEALSPSADVIVYNGHAGLGQNVQALARKGRFLPNRYLMLFMNGCDTFAYVDGYLAQTRAALNPSDPEGTKFMDIVTNGMPSYFHSNARASSALVKGLMNIARPQTFEQMFAEIDSVQVVHVTGEEDNAFTPGMSLGSGGGSTGGERYELDDRGSLAKGKKKEWKTPPLEPGKYTVRLAHDPDAAPSGGDVDLYVRAGSKPTLTKYDCRPYESGSDEVCEVQLATKQSLFVMASGYAAQTSSFTISIRQD